MPGWGRQMDADQIIREGRDLGLSALDYQPGLFPEDAQAARAQFEGPGTARPPDGCATPGDFNAKVAVPNRASREHLPLT
jgi:hypothetical protein